MVFSLSTLIGCFSGIILQLYLILLTCDLNSSFNFFSVSKIVSPYGFLLFHRYFMYDGLKHSCLEGDHIVNIFSFSKAYGMMGWRVGYVSNS